MCSFPKVGCDVSAREICIFGVRAAKNASLLSPSHSKTSHLSSSRRSKLRCSCHRLALFSAFQRQNPLRINFLFFSSLLQPQCRQWTPNRGSSPSRSCRRHLPSATWTAAPTAATAKPKIHRRNQGWGESQSPWNGSPPRALAGPRRAIA